MPVKAEVLCVMNPEIVLTKLYAAIDLLIERSARYNGLFPSILNPQTGDMLLQKPPKIPGQRDGDRAHLGSNLIHDAPLLATMTALAECQSKPGYVAAVDRYLAHFANRCTQTATGLFPWGEHAFWHLIEERVGCSRNPASSAAIHDHLRQVPLWLWEKLNTFNPTCVQRFADGLAYHWTAGDGLEYIRHANIDTKTRLARGDRACDFPRHSGFYVFDLTFAYTQAQRSETDQHLRWYTEYWWTKRDARGLLRIESRSPNEAERFFQKNAPAQTLSLGVSLLEAAALVETLLPELAGQMRCYGKVYIEGFLAAPHDLETREFVSLCECETNRVFEQMSAWGSVYGASTACSTGVLCLGGWRLTQDERLLTFARAIGDMYREAEFPVARVDTDALLIPASDAGLALELFADLYDITGESVWLESGLQLAETALAVYFPERLPYGASGIDWYESQMGVAFLVHGLARVALLARSRTCPLPPDYTAR